MYRRSASFGLFCRTTGSPLPHDRTRAAAPSRTGLTLATAHAMIDPHSWLPLLPLHTVLFPDGILPLRIFETRYLDMGRHCLKQEAPFGVVLIRSGAETGTAAEPENVGCLAQVIDWDAQEDGLLLLRTQGSRRFRIIETRVRSNDQLEARVELWSSDEPL